MTKYLRTNRGFTAVSTYASSGRLSAGAIGLLTLILSNHDVFVIYKGALQRRSKFGKKLFKRFWQELEENGFVYEIKSNNGRINYEYIIVNDPSHESNIEAIDQILENRELFLIDGEMDTENDLLNIVDGEEGTNIHLNNKDLSNVDINNVDINNSSLGIRESLNNIEKLVEYWYFNVNDKQLNEDESQILEDELFVSTYTQLISILRVDPSMLNSINYQIPLSDLFKIFENVKNDHIYQDQPFTSFYLANELILILQLEVL